MGIYRLLLAVAVLLSHLHIRAFGANIGVFAVVSFFLLSGYVMTALIDRHYSQTSSIGRFYLDRAMRLFPQFLFYVLLTLALIAIAHPESPFISGLSASKVMMNVAMLPLNFSQVYSNSIIIPQAWSLGLEAQFYVVIPLIVIFRIRAAALVASAAFFVLPYLGVLNADIWGYRMLPGTLFVFLFGSFIYRRESTTALILAYAVACTLLLGIGLFPDLHRPYNFEVLAGLVFGVPAVWLLSKVRFGKLEEIAGDLSYGVFLNHFFVIWLFQSIGIKPESHGYIAFLIASSIALSFVSYAVIERPVIAVRRALRSRVKACHAASVARA